MPGILTDINIGTIKIVAACARIHWSGSIFDRRNWLVLGVLEQFKDLRRPLDVPDGHLLALLAVSATAIMQPLVGLKIRR